MCRFNEYAGFAWFSCHAGFVRLLLDGCFGRCFVYVKQRNAAASCWALRAGGTCTLLRTNFVDRNTGRQSHGWGTTQRREWILDELRNRFCTIFATDSWHLALAIRYLHALIHVDPYICNHNVMYTLVRWYLTESHHKCSRMCLWRDVDMQRIIDEPKIAVTDYLRRRNRLLTTG